MRYSVFLSLICLLPGLLHADPKPAAGKKQLNLVESYQLIEEFLSEEKHGDAVKQCRSFLSGVNGSPSLMDRAQVNLYLALSLERLGKDEEAIQEYGKLWTRYRGWIHITTPAISSWMQLMWKRNRPAQEGVMANREEAVLHGRRYVHEWRGRKDKMKQKDREAFSRFEKLVQQYEAELKKE